MLSKILRAPLALIPAKAHLPILSGPLRGSKWIKGAGPNAYWVGTFEPSQLRAFANAIGPGAVVYDIGANVGLYSLLAATRAGVEGAVYSFEPLPRNLAYLRRHLELNRLKNCVVIETVICNTVGTRPFSVASWDSSMARLSAHGELEVPATTVDDLVYRAALRPPNVMKVDVEGAEFEVLQGADRTISEYHPALFLEIHGTELHADCRSFLGSKGYRMEEEVGRIRATWATWKSSLPAT